MTLEHVYKHAVQMVLPFLLCCQKEDCSSYTFSNMLSEYPEFYCNYRSECNGISIEGCEQSVRDELNNMKENCHNQGTTTFDGCLASECMQWLSERKSCNITMYGCQWDEWGILFSSEQLGVCQNPIQ